MKKTQAKHGECHIEVSEWTQSVHYKRLTEEADAFWTLNMKQMAIRNQDSPSTNKREVQIPPALAKELRLMRRDPAHFRLLRTSRCKFCASKVTMAHDLSHQSNQTNAGA